MDSHATELAVKDKEIENLKKTIDRQSKRILALSAPLTAAERKILESAPLRLLCDRPLSRGATGLDRMAASMRLPK